MKKPKRYCGACDVAFGISVALILASFAALEAVVLMGAWR